MTTDQHFYRACVYCASRRIRRHRSNGTALDYLEEQKWTTFLREAWGKYKDSWNE